MPLENMGWLSHKTRERMTEPLLLHIEGAQEGWRAFLEKRTPQFRGY